jgi:protein TonB
MSIGLRDKQMAGAKPKMELAGAQGDTGYEQKQRKRMFLALILLLTALMVILIKDRRLWFGPEESASDADYEDTVDTPATNSATRPTAQATKPKRRIALKEEIAEAAPPPAVVNRTALPPLEIEVVAGGESRQTVRPTNNSVKVDTQQNAALPSKPSTASAAAPSASGPAVSASQRVKLSADTLQVVERPVDPSYPMLARQMKVQGSVVLEALIGTDGLIQDLRVLSGPAILSSAAREAVRQWRFKPYLQNGRAVETEAKITVNFTISTF